MKPQLHATAVPYGNAVAPEPMPLCRAFDAAVEGLEKMNDELDARRAAGAARDKREITIRLNVENLDDLEHRFDLLLAKAAELRARVTILAARLGSVEQALGVDE